MTKIRMALATLAALLMVVFMAVPANAATAWPEDWSCLNNTCAKTTWNGANAMRITVKSDVSSSARTTRFAGTNQNVQICVTYVAAPGSYAAPQLWNSSGLNVVFPYVAHQSGLWGEVCKYTYLSGTNMNLVAWGSLGHSVYVRKVVVNP